MRNYEKLKSMSDIESADLLSNDKLNASPCK